MARIQINKYLVADSEICHGKPTFNGTRVMVWQILGMLAVGEEVEEILADFPQLTKAHIAAALEYAARTAEGTRFIPTIKQRPLRHAVLSR